MKNQFISKAIPTHCVFLLVLLTWASSATWAGNKCGDGQCSRGENAKNCPADCGGGEPPPDEGSPSSDCRLDFSAVFRDADDDGVQSDGEPYAAFGGTGMRLDTNSSQKLERKNDTRFVWVDFSVPAYCDAGGLLPDDPHNPAAAAGFCSDSKGVDMRIEHQVQEPQGLCSIEPYEESLPVSAYSMLQTVKIHFQGGPDPLLKELDGSESPSFILNYGCQGLRIDPAISIKFEPYRVLITRLDQHTWIFEGEEACLTTQLGNVMTDENGPIHVNMPFALCIEDIDGPMSVCDDYF
jgi:hypothetical protein